MLRKIIFMAFLPVAIHAQQESKVTIGSGNKNTIEIAQKGKDTIQKSDIKITKSDSNTVKIDQDNTEKNKIEDTSILKFLFEYAYYISATILALIGIWQFSKNTKNK